MSPLSASGAAPSTSARSPRPRKPQPRRHRPRPAWRALRNRRPTAGLLALLGLLLVAGCTPGSAAGLRGGHSSDSTQSGTLPATTAAPGSGLDLEGEPVDPGLFGTHVVRLTSTDAPLPARAGAVRLWDSGVAWRQIEKVEGEIDWAKMDRAVSAAEQTGASEILWVMGSTPEWAAKDPESDGLYGPGSSSPPRTAAYVNILREVASRYRGRITAYQVWNEANLGLFYRGTPGQLAALTEKAHEALQEVDPDALLIGASTTIRRKGPVKEFYDKYLKALAKRDWPVDALAVHLYPLADQGAGTRAAYIRMIRPWLAERGWDGPVWDTEINYGDRRDFASQIVHVSQATAAAWVARTYIDSLALGIDRVFWYSWNDHLLGIDQVDPETDLMQPAGQAFLTVQEWFDGAWWQGCSGELMDPTGERGALTTCRIQDGTSGVKSRILFAHGAATTVPMPDEATEVCSLDGTCQPAVGKELAVGKAPVLVRLG